MRIPLIYLFITIILAFPAVMHAEPSRLVRGLTKKNTSYMNQRITSKTWKSEENTQFTSKSFPIKEWDKHFSSVGSKRAAIEMNEGKDKKIFKTKTKEFPTKEYEMSGWNEKFTKLQGDARISTDDKARKIADRQLYNMMLQDTRKYNDLGVELSLRDLNRYQFRRNRSDEGVPTAKVGDQ
ncbi:MAG: hypothetical protein ACSHX8_00015 [Opitutaceae bacterium]